MEENKYEIKDIVKLDDEREYSIIKEIDGCFVFLSIDEPLKIIVGKIENDRIVIVTDQEVIRKVLSS